MASQVVWHRITLDGPELYLRYLRLSIVTETNGSLLEIDYMHGSELVLGVRI